MTRAFNSNANQWFWLTYATDHASAFAHPCVDTDQIRQVDTGSELSSGAEGVPSPRLSVLSSRLLVIVIINY